MRPRSRCARGPSSRDPDPPEVTIASPNAGALPAVAEGEPAKVEVEVEVEARDTIGVARVLLRLPCGQEIARKLESGEGVPPDRYAPRIDATDWPADRLRGEEGPV
jgi:hypothetical protein